MVRGVSLDRVSDELRVALVTAACALLYAMPAILNGVPFFYVDSATYLAQGQEALRAFAPWLVPAGAEAMPPAADAPPVVTNGAPAGADAPVVVSGRSIYYGVLAYLGVAHGGGAGLIGLQALAVAWPLTLLCRAAAPRAWDETALGLAATTAFLTPAGLFVGLVTPDIWLAAMGLAAAAMLMPAAPSLAGRLSLAAIVAYGAVVHTSHLLVLLAGVVVLAAACLWPHASRSRARWSLARWPQARWTAGTLAACAALAVAANVLFGAVVEYRFGAPPIARPHLTARLTDAGPGVAAARALCGQDDAAPAPALASAPASEAPFAVCAYLDRLPMAWTRFLFEDDPASGVFEAASPATKRRLAAEDKRFAMATLRHAPFETTAVLVGDAMRQLVTYDAVHVPITASSNADALGPLPPGLEARIEAGRTYPHRGVFVAIDRASSVLFVLCALGVGAAWLKRGRFPLPAALGALVLLFVIAANAGICGALASPYGRFGARIAWVFVPAAALLIVPALAARVPERSPRP